MSKKRATRDWGRTLIEWGSQGRDWLRAQSKGEWGIGFFEGLVVAVFLYYFFKTYGSAIDGTLSGSRELGHQRKDLKDKRTPRKIGKISIRFGN